MTDRALRLRCLAFATLTLFCALKLPAQQKKLDEQRRIQMESSVARFMASGSVPGVSVAVVETESLSGLVTEFCFEPGTRSSRAKIASAPILFSTRLFGQLIGFLKGGDAPPFVRRLDAML